MAARTSYSPYAELGLAAGAPAREVRRAFLRIARQFHPDKCDDPGAGERFRRAQEAFAAITRAGAGALGQAPESTPDVPACPSDSDSWEPPPRPAEKKAEPAEVVDPDEPVLCLEELLQLLRQHCEGGVPSAASLRRRFLQATVPWPWDLGGPALHAALARSLRDELDARVSAMELARLSKQDLGWWLEAHGSPVRLALEDDSVPKEALARLARELLATGAPSTPVPELAGRAAAPGASSGASAGNSGATDAMGQRLAVALSARPAKRKRSGEEGVAPLAKEEEYARWLQQAAAKGNAKHGALYLLKLAEAGDVFRGKRLAVKPLRAAIRRYGVDLGE